MRLHKSQLTAGLLASGLLLAAPAALAQEPWETRGETDEAQEEESTMPPSYAPSTEEQEKPVQEIQAREVDSAQQSAPAASTYQAEARGPRLATDAGWNSQYALLFQLNNIFVVNSILNSYLNMGAGFQYNLDPELAVRVGIDFGRSSNPADVTKTTTRNGSQTISTYAVNASQPTEQWSLDLAADAIMRLSRWYVAPYLGAGLFFDWSRSATRYKDDVSVTDQVTEVNNSDNGYTLGLRGLFGAEWRIHEHFAIFAEYALNVGIFTIVDEKDETTVRDERTGTSTTQRTTVEHSETRWLNTSLGLRHGASFGLAAHF